MANVPLPKTEIDGKNIWDLIKGEKEAKNPHDYYAFTTGSNFESVMSGDGKWKLHLPHAYRTLEKAGMDGIAGKYVQAQIDTALFDMDNDPYEITNVLQEHPDIAIGLIELAETHISKFYSK